MGIRLNEGRVDRILQRLEAGTEGLTRHRQYTWHKYNSIYGISDKKIDEQLELLFKITIRQHGGPPDYDRYTAGVADFQKSGFETVSSHADAFQVLLEVNGVGPKIANEFLRKAVHVFEYNPEWIPELDVPLDTHVVNALIKTGGIELTGEDESRESQSEIVNFTPNSQPDTKIGYDEIQDTFKQVATDHDYPKIVFDELWLEDKYYISDGDFRTESCLQPLIE